MVRTPPLDTCTREELMVIAAARALSDGVRCLVGVGLPNIAANLAKRTHAPGAELIYESGVVDPFPRRLPTTVGDGALVSGASAVSSMLELLGYYVQGGRIDIGILGAAQIDRLGHINTTVIGPYGRPEVRLPGSGGACEIAQHARQLVVIMRQRPRSFVEKVDFVTSSIAPANRAQPAGATLIVTDLAVFEYKGHNEIRVVSMHAGVGADEVAENIAWPIDISPATGTTSLPSAEELRVMRQDLGYPRHTRRPSSA